MVKYSKPMVIVDQGLAEGVYAASGAGCYKASADIHQKPDIGRGDYRIQVNGQHKADHKNDAQLLTISFNQTVTYSGSNGTLVGANTGTTLTIRYTYHNNENDNIGLGDLIVTSDAGLAITGVSITD